MTDYVYKQKNLIYWIVFLISLSELDTLVDGLRYIKYAILPLALFSLFHSSYLNRNFGLGPLKAFSFILAYSLIFAVLSGFQISNLGAKDWLFISCYVIPLLAFYNNEVSIEKIFQLFLIFTLMSFIGMEVQDFSIESSSAPFEGSSSFVFAGFLYYFFLRKSKFYMLISAIMMFLTLKRIALLGVCLIFIFHTLSKMNFRPKTLKKCILALFVLFLITMLLIASGSLDEIILEVTGKSANWFTLGRSTHYQGLFEQLYQNPTSIIFGNGLGSAYSYASIYHDSEEYRTDANLHSDILKIAFELGLFGYIVFFNILCKGLSSKSSLMILYIAIIFLTDNILIYTGPMFILLTICLKVNYLDNKRDFR